MTKINCKLYENSNYNTCFNYYLQGCYVSCRFLNPVDIEDFLTCEKKKETCRFAARNRRSIESIIFQELQEMIPLPEHQLKNIGKTSIIRLTNSYLKTRKILDKNLNSDLLQSDTIEEAANFDSDEVLNMINGFLLLLSSDGVIRYASENVQDFLGINFVDVTGESIFEFAHACDHKDIKEMLSSDEYKMNGFFIRLKCTISHTGRLLNLKSANYKTFHFLGHVFQNQSSNENNFLFMCQSIPHPINLEHSIDSNIFLTKHSLDMKFSYVDDKFIQFGYSANDLLNESLYSYIHTGDLDEIANCFRILYTKGQCETCRYRLLAKNGGFVWILTQATVIYDKFSSPQNVVCIHYALSGIENDNEIYSDEQLISINNKSSKSANNYNDKKLNTTKLINNQLSEEDDLNFSREFETATWKIFGPRTPEMNQGFLTFSDETPGLTMLKEDPDDLTHLAPTAGDVCVPLEPISFITPDLFNEILMKDNYASYLNELVDSNQSLSSNRMDSVLDSIAYHQLIDDLHCSNILTPPLSKTSEKSSPNNSLIDEDSLGNYITFPLGDHEDFRSNETFSTFDSNKLSLLTSEDLMWGALGASVRDKKSSTASDLERLLTSSNVNHNLVNPSKVLGAQINQSKDEKNKVEKSERSMNKRNHNYLPQEQNGNNSKRSKITSENLTATSNKSTSSNNNSNITMITSNGAKKKDVYWIYDTGGTKSTMASTATISQLNNRNPNLNANRITNHNQSADKEESDSVLMNLLVSGCDLKAGYYCLPPKKAQKCNFIS